VPLTSLVIDVGVHFEQLVASHLLDHLDDARVEEGLHIAVRVVFLWTPTRAGEFQGAGRAYRLLYVKLREQGLSTHATRFHYRSELMERKAIWHRGFDSIFGFPDRNFLTSPALFGRWFFSWLLGTFAGYGDYVGRLFLTYGVVVLAFAAAIFVFAGQTPSLNSIGDALILSVTSFHGRGVQPPGLHLNDALAALSGAEAVFGLLIEGLFIAAFTRRVTGG
jgi:hypothetical protein